MSFHRANVTWQSPDGSWNIGFWTVLEPDPEDDEDYDAEWDVEYGDDFEWVTTGHPSEDSAWRTVNQHRPNPGSSYVCSLTNSSDAERAELEDLAASCAARVPRTPADR